jgi:phytoene desaturase
VSRVVVIGAGLSGLAAACHLLGAGHDVTVVEREPIVGGRCGRLDQDGFSFDTGPTVMTMPELVGEALNAVGVDLGQVLPMRRMDPGYRARYADGSRIDVRFGRAAMRAEIERTCGPADAAAFDGFVDWLAELYDIELPNFIDRNFDSALGLVSRPMAALRLLRLGAFGRLGPAVARRFADPRLQRLFSFQAMYAGLAPADALALYAVITYMDSIAGVWFPEGGMHAVPTAMAAAIEKAGGELVLDSQVTGLLRRRDGAIAGVRLAGGAGVSADSEAVPADAVVCTLDLPIAYDQLLPELSVPRALRRPTYSPSAVVWHVGVRGEPNSDVAHHNIHFGSEWDTAFDALLDRGELMPDPSRLVTVPSLDDPTAAPAGCSTLFVLEPVPNLAAGRVDWRTEAGPMRERLAGFLEREGYPSDIVTERLVTPLEWRAQGMAAGTPFALAHTFAQTGPFRPPNAERRVPGLFFAGSGTVPGVGVPMVLISGKLAAHRATSYLGGVQ